MPWVAFPKMFQLKRLGLVHGYHSSSVSTANHPKYAKMKTGISFVYLASLVVYSSDCIIFPSQRSLAKFIGLSNFLRMGTWSEDIFGNDMACDVRAAYRERIAAGDDAEAAFKRVKKEFASALRDADDKRTIYIALAAAQQEADKVIDSVREVALKSIAWCENPNRDLEDFPYGLEALAQLREKLGGTAPPVCQSPKPKLPPGEPGEVYAITLPDNGFRLKTPGKPIEAVIFVGGLVRDRPPATGRVVVFPDLPVAKVTPKSVGKALEEWHFYRQQWPNGLGRLIHCYDICGKLPPRKSRLLLSGIQMPEAFARRMQTISIYHPVKDLPHLVVHDLWEWHEYEWAVDPKLDQPD